MALGSYGRLAWCFFKWDNILLIIFYLNHMRFLLLVKSSLKVETGALPDLQLFAAMEKYNDRLKAAGMLLGLDGLEPSAKGVRIGFGGGEPTVTPGPFPLPEELVSGYWIIRAASLDEAIAWAKQAPFPGGVIEVRQIQEMADFSPEIQAAIDRK